MSYEAMLKKVKSCAGNSNIKAIYTFNKTEGAPNLQDLITDGNNNPRVNELNAIKASIKSTDLATLIYT